MVIDKTIQVSVDICVARKMLSVAGYTVQNMSNDEIFKLALSISETYGVSYCYDKEVDYGT